MPRRSDLAAPPRRGGGLLAAFRGDQLLHCFKGPCVPCDRKVRSDPHRPASQLRVLSPRHLTAPAGPQSREVRTPHRDVRPALGPHPAKAVPAQQLICCSHRCSQPVSLRANPTH